MTAYELLAKHMDNVQALLQDHGCLLRCLKGGEDASGRCKCVAACPYERKLKNTLLEAIQVLEESRKAFKSRQLEMLRRKLIGVLAEID